MSCSHDHHDHSDHLPPPNTNQAQTLYPYIDRANVRAANCAVSSAAAKIIRPYDQRLEETPVLESDVDEELIIVIPFTGAVKLHSVLMRSLGDDSSPRQVQLYKDMPQLDFDTAASTKPTQVLEYPANVGLGVSTSEGTDDIVQFAVNRPKFTNMSSLTIYIPHNYGAEQTALTYIGLRGECSAIKRAPVIATYEAAANPADLRAETDILGKNKSRLG